MYWLIRGNFNYFKWQSDKSEFYLILFFDRSLEDHETYVVILNLGAREETLNIHDLVKGFADYSEVVLAGAETAYDIG